MKLAFFMAVYSEFMPARQKILQLQQLYPGANLVVVTDGTYEAAFADFCLFHDVYYKTGERLKLQQFGGLWTARMLELLLMTEADTFFKIDPGDTAIHRAFRYLPPPEVELFGDIRETVNKRKHVQGGCIGLRREGVRKLLESNRLGDEQFCKPWYSYPRFDPDAHFRYLKPGEEALASKDWITVEDLILYDLAVELGLVIGQFEEVYCHYKQLPTGLPDDYAMTHPSPSLV